jgi:putative (di)nucleoside polyphosphate hydrolase
MLADESDLSLDRCDQPEFRDYRWVDFWYPVEHVIPFKRRVYRQALTLLEPMAATPGAL